MSEQDQQLPPGVQEMGRINQEEAQALNAAQQSQRNILLQLGELEVKKSHLLAQHGKAEAEGRTILQGVSTRLGIASNWPWQVQADGRVLAQEPPEPQVPLAPDLDDSQHELPPSTPGEEGEAPPTNSGEEPPDVT